MMLKKFVLMWAMLLSQNFCLATMFFPLSLEKQVEEASAGVEVRLISSKVFKNVLGQIMTEYRFDVLEAYNLSDDDLENQKLKLTMPGGSLEGITSMIDGAPQFNQEEKSFLLLKKIETQIYLSNFTLGKYKIQQHEGKTYYVSEVYPMDPNIGRITKDKMIELMNTKWKTSSVDAPEAIMKSATEASRVRPLAAALFKNTEKRQPAQEANFQQEVPFFFWSAIAIVAFFFVFIFFKLSNREH